MILSVSNHHCILKAGSSFDRRRNCSAYIPVVSGEKTHKKIVFGGFTFLVMVNGPILKVLTTLVSKKGCRGLLPLLKCVQSK